MRRLRDWLFGTYKGIPVYVTITGHRHLAMEPNYLQLVVENNQLVVKLARPYTGFAHVPQMVDRVVVLSEDGYTLLEGKFTPLGLVAGETLTVNTITVPIQKKLERVGV